MKFANYSIKPIHSLDLTTALSWLQDNISGPTLDCSLVSNGSGPLPSNGFDHDYSAVGPAANPTGDYDLPEESQGPEDVYVHPPCTENELYSHLSRRHYEAIDRKYIE